jgi:hypothetical protein
VLAARSRQPQRVAEYTASLAGGARPTAVAVSTLDVCAPVVDEGADYYTHWALTHFLLDGHHRMQAAAEAARPLQLLSMLSVDASLGSAEQVAQIPSLRAPPRKARGLNETDRNPAKCYKESRLAPTDPHLSAGRSVR